MMYSYIWDCPISGRTFMFKSERANVNVRHRMHVFFNAKGFNNKEAECLTGNPAALPFKQRSSAIKRYKQLFPSMNYWI